MSKEAVGRFGVKIGSSAYWSGVNRASGLCSSLDSKTNYQTMLQELGTRASSAIEEIYEDLETQGSKIRYIPSSERNALANQVEGLYDVCKMAGASSRHSNDCIQALNLSIMSPWSDAFRDETAIDNAISLINRQRRYSTSETIRMLQEAAKWSVSFVAGADDAKKEFLDAVLQGKNNSFLKDVADEYESKNAIQSFTGRCGYSVGSRSYLECFEAKVFGGALPVTNSATFGRPSYETAVREALNSVAEQLERDLEDAARQNDYITDEAAAELKSVADNLNACGVNVGFIHQKIDRLAWFVGGDPDKIRRLQSALNDLDVGQHLEEDGVYGEKTKKAVDDFIEKISNFLADENKMRLLDRVVDATAAVLGFMSGQQNQMWSMHNALEKNRQELQRTIWKLGAEYYLRPRGYSVAALLLEHSLEKSPSDLHFSQSHWVTQKIMESNGFQQFCRNLEGQIKSSDLNTMSGSELIVFGNTGDTDLYLGLGTCTIKYTCERRLSSAYMHFTVYDKYDFDKIRSISGDVEHFVKFNLSIGNLANDAGLFSQADGVISRYEISADFQKTIEIGDMH